MCSISRLEPEKTSKSLRIPQDVSSRSGNGGPFRRGPGRQISSHLWPPLVVEEEKIQIFLYPESIIEVVEHRLEVLKGP